MMRSPARPSSSARRAFSIAEVPLAEHEGLQLGFLALVHQIDVALVGRKLLARCLHQFEQALDADRETAGWRRLAAEHFHQRVVTAATANRPLRAELVGHPLEDRAVVIVHAAHQAWIDRVRNVAVAQDVLHAVEMRF